MSRRSKASKPVRKKELNNLLKKYEEEVTPSTGPATKTEKSNSVVKDLYFGEVENTFAVSGYYPDSMKRPYNPDPLVEKDHTYGVYEDMLKDDQVYVALELKKDLVVGSGWYLDVQDESQGDMKKELENLISDETDRPLSEMLSDMLQSYAFGFSVSEKIFKKTTSGKLTLKDIKPRHPSTWLLHTDDHGTIIRYEQRAKNASIDVNPDSIIHYVNNDRFQNPYGRSDLYSAYQAYITKRHVSRFYAIYLENAAGPKPVGKYLRGASDSVKEDLFNALKSFQTKTAMVVPKEFDIEFLEAKTDGEAYVKGLNLFNMYIGRALFIPDLIGFQGSETGGGSFSLGQEQIGIFYKHIYRRRQTLERIIDKHIIKPLVIYNYGIQVDYPKFKFLPLSDVDALRQAETWIKGIQGAGWSPTLDEVNHFRNIIKFPQSDDLELKAVAVAGEMENNFGDAPGKKDDENGEDDDDHKKEDPKEEKKESKEPVKEDKKEEFKLAQSTLPGDYKKRVDFKMADNLLKNSELKILEELEPIVTDAFDDLYSQISRRGNAKPEDVDKLDEIGIRGKYLKQMQGVFKKHYKQLYKDSQIMAKAEVKRSDNAKKRNQNIPADEFLAYLEKETFQYVGDWEYTITKKAKTSLNTAIKDGQPLSNVVSVLDDEGKKLSDVSLERYSRTKSTEVFNRGRMEYFNSTGVVAAYQFAAILDDVTSEVCGNLHGLTFPAGEAPVPPMHFNALRHDSLILTNKGIYPINQVKIGDLVLTHEGNWKRVYDVMSKFEDKEYYEINLKNGETLNATGEHPVLIMRDGKYGWIRVDELTELDDIICLEDMIDVRKIG